jgi:hypothetical protein
MIETNFVLLKAVTLNTFKNFICVLKNWSFFIILTHFGCIWQTNISGVTIFGRGCVILGVFTTLRKAAVSFVMSVCVSISLSVGMEQISFNCKGFIEI